MQLFTSTPSTNTEHAPQFPVSQPMWLPVRSRSSRRKWMSRRRASTSRSYVAPFTSTVIVLRLTGSTSVPSCGLGDRASCEHLGQVAPVVGRGVNVGGRVEVRALHRRAHILV